MCCVPQKERSNFRRGCTEKVLAASGPALGRGKAGNFPGQQTSTMAVLPCTYSPLSMCKTQTQFGGALASAAQDRDDEVGLIITVDGQEVADAVPTWAVFSGADCSDLAFQSPSIRK